MLFEEFAQAVQKSEDPRVVSFRENINSAKPEELSSLFTPRYDKDDVQKWLDTQDGFLTMQPRLDKAKSEAIAKFREKELQKILDDDFAKRYAEKHPPENAELAKLQQEVSEVKRQNKELALKTFAAKILGEKGLSLECMDYILLDEEELIEARINKLHEFIVARANEEVQGRVNKTSKPEPQGATSVQNKPLGKDAPLVARINEKLKAHAALKT